VANNSGNNSIDVTLSTGAPKTLLWKGYINNTWDNSTYNWLDLNTGLHTNFVTLDKVAFDDTAANSSIIVSGDMVPSQSPGGIQMTNNSLAYTFTTATPGDGTGRLLGGASLTKIGANGLTNDLYAEYGASVDAGSFSITANGTVGGAIVASGASLANGGTVLGSVACAGTAVNLSTIDGALAIQSSGIVTNSGTVNGALSMFTNSLFCNNGTMNNIGSPITATNTTLVNSGVMYGSSLTVGGTLIDLAPDSVGVSPGSINVGTLTVNGTFEPGGNAIGTTAVTDYNVLGSQTGNPNGRIQLTAGSVTILQVNTAASPANTLVLSQNQGFGPSQAGKAFNGCTLVITNLGPALTAGESFKFFGQYYSDGNIGNAGLNTTNAYPIIQPATPGPGLAWDLSQLIPGGYINVLSATDPSLIFTVTNNIYVGVGGSNIITELTWPADKIGGWVEQLNTSLTNGLSATNWITPSGGYYTNMYSVNDLLFTNTLVGDPTAIGSAVFYRFVWP
jgi:hypothetical protein